MYQRKGKDYFKKTSIAISIIYFILLSCLLYCIGVIVLPPFAIWCYNTIHTALVFFSFGSQELLYFNTACFYTCTGILTVVGISLKIYDYIQFKKQHADLDL